MNWPVFYTFTTAIMAALAYSFWADSQPKQPDPWTSFCDLEAQ